MTIRTTNIRDHNLRAAAELIDRAIGKKGDREVTEGDLDAAAALLAKQGGGVLSTKQAEIVAKALPQLRALLGTEEKKSTLTPFATSLWTTAIADPKVRDCAQAIAKALSGDGEDLQLGKFLDARDALNGKVPHGREDRVAEATQKLAEAIKSGVVNKDAMGALDVFFLEGIGGIMSHGPVKVSGVSYDDVFRLPVKSMGKDGKTPDVEGAIDEYERRFKDVSYDRVYIGGPDGELYVALHKKGKLTHVDEGYRVTMRDEMDQAASGEVLRVVDIANSFGEATWHLWLDGLKSAADALTGGFKRVAGDAINKAVNRVGDELTDPSDKDKRVDLKSVGLAVWVTGTTATAAFNLPIALGALAIGGAGITAASLLSWLQKSDDLAPIFHAMGVTVNKTDAVTA